MCGNGANPLKTGMAVTCMTLSVRVELLQLTGMRLERWSVHKTALEKIIVGQGVAGWWCGTCLSCTCCNTNQCVKH